MLKKTFLSLSAIAAVVLPAVHLHGSVANLREAASLSAASTASKSVVATSSVTATIASLTTSSPRKSTLDRVLDDSGVRANQRPLAAAVLGMLEPSCLEKLRTFSVLYGNPKNRGLAGKGVILVSGEVPDKEFVGLLLHEGLGHYRDITCVTGSPAAGASAFRDGTDPIWNDDPSVAFYSISWINEKTMRESARRNDFVTGYAHDADNFEDLAESVTYYMTQESAFRQRAERNVAIAKKLAWLETYMPKTVEVGDGSPWDGKIAWDATKLSFNWSER